METCVASVNYLVVVTSFDWRQKLYADVKFLPFFSYLPAFTVHACKANVASTVARVCAKNCFRAAQRDAPNVRVLSRIWRVVAGLSLQTCATFPSFVVVSALVDHICRVFSTAFVVVLADLGNICRVFYPAFVVGLVAAVYSLLFL